MRLSTLLTSCLLAVVLAACSGSSSGPKDPSSPEIVDQIGSEDRQSEFYEGDSDEIPSGFSHEIITHTPAAATGVATGDYFDLGVEYPPIAVGPEYKNVLSFQMTPWAFPLRAPDPSSGPLVLFTDDLNTIVFAPLDHPFVSVVNFVDGQITYGVQGEVEAIPQGFTHRFVLVKGKGINATIEYWGEVMRRDRGIDKRDRYADSGLSYLGYWTDNGAAYFYSTIPGMNYQETLLEMKAEAGRLGIPYGYFQIDSWWYFRGPEIGIRKGGLDKWEPDPLVFPDGLEKLHQLLGLPMVAHNKWFILDNSYVNDHEFVAGPNWAIPLGIEVYREFMSNAKKWGIETYEPDWLMSHIWEIPWLRQGIYNAETWMDDQNDAAQEQGLTMQLCMAGPGHLLYALDMPAVTTFRTSIDYKKEVSKESFWPMFHTVNMLTSAVGIWPFKDNFWSSEKFGEAEALISNLSGGMVGVGDPYQKAKPEILLRTCRTDGLLLKPDKSATPIDAMFLPHKRPYTTATLSARPGLGRWFYVAAYNLVKNHESRGPIDMAFAVLTYDGRDLGEMFVWPEKITDWAFDMERDLGLAAPHVLYNWRTKEAQVVEGNFNIPEMTQLYDHAYLVLAPVLPNKLALIGEHGKFVTLADKRFGKIEYDTTGVTFQLAGAPGETVEVLAYCTHENRLLDPLVVTLDAQGQGQGRFDSHKVRDR